MKLKDFLKETGGKTRDFGQMDPRLLQVRPGFNIRDLTTPAAREKLDILKAQIKAEGVLEALEIEFDGTTPWINEGHRRHMMVMELIEEGEAFETIPVVQERSNIKADKRTLHMLMRGKEDYEPLEYAKGLERMVNVYGWDKGNLARSLGFKSKASIDGYLDMLAMPDAIQDQVRSGTVSATAALKVSRDTQTPDELKAQIIKDAAGEQKRLGKSYKATPKALKAASERAKPKPPAETKAPATAPAEPTTETGAPVEGAHSLDQLQEKIKEVIGIDGGGVTQFRSDMLPHDLASDMGLAPEASAPAEFHQLHAERTMPQPSNKIEALLVGFIAADVQGLALQYAKLRREYEETVSESGDAMQGQEELCVAADVIGQLRFPEDWENAKATTELAQVA